MIDPSQLPPPGDPAMAMAPALGAEGPGVTMPGMPQPPGAGPVMAADGMPQEQKKPPLLLPPKLARELAQGYVDQVRSMSTMISDQTGPPEEFERMKVADQVRAWNKRNPTVDPLALKEQGLSPIEIRDKVYPLRRVMLKMVGPKPTERARFAERMKAESLKAESAKTDTITSSDPAMI